MAKLLGPIELDCDAPDYSVVQACRVLGLHSPEDVCWRRIRNFIVRSSGARLLFDLWKRLRLWNIPASSVCACGQTFPELQKVAFTFNTGEKEIYLLGQCSHCHAVYWENL